MAGFVLPSPPLAASGTLPLYASHLRTNSIPSLFPAPAGLAVGLALKEQRYAGYPAIRPRRPRPPMGSPFASAVGPPRRFGLTG